MAKRAKKAPLQRRVKRTSAKKNAGESGIVSISPTHYEHGEYAHAISHASVNLMEQSGNRFEHIRAGYVSGTPEENKNQRLELRLTKLQKDFISKASSVSGFKNVSDYILHIAISDSKNVIREQQIFELSERDRISFMETLENPPEPGKNLKKAMASYLSFQEGK
jgi:uncharacterized protein (DUF1778 family)